MANDRIYIACKFCAGNLMLYKYYPSGSGYVFPEQEAIDTFITEHIECNPHAGITLDGESGFVFVTESLLNQTKQKILEGIGEVLG